MVLLTRLFVVVISVFAYLLALGQFALLVQLLPGAYGAVVQLFPLIVAAFFWKRATTAGAYAGLISGSLATILFTFVVTPTPLDIHAGIWGLLANTVFLVGTSLLTHPMDREHVKRFVEGSKTPLEEMPEPQTEEVPTA